MIRFTHNSYIVEVKTACNPAEDYTETMGELIDLMQSEDDEMSKRRFFLLSLLRAMLPTYDQAIAMDQDFAEDKCRMLKIK